MKVPKPFWADAVSTACFLINRMPSSVLNGDIPYTTLFPSKSLFPIEPKIFGSTCFVRDVRQHRTKLDPKSLKCVFLGYSRVQKGYNCFSPDLNRYLVSSDVTFHENVPFFPYSSTHLDEGENETYWFIPCLNSQSMHRRKHHIFQIHRSRSTYYHRTHVLQ